jgi:hypothetical protein
MHPTFNTVVISLLGITSCTVAIIASSAVRRTAGIFLQIVWLYFVTGSRS